MFMHGGLLHIGGNMLFLWVFGNNVEDAMGRVKFAFFYLLGGLAAMGAADRRRPEQHGARASARRGGRGGARAATCSSIRARGS